MKIIPELRFPEFNTEEEWKAKPLGYFCDYWNGSSNEGVIIEDGRYHLISLNSIDIEGNLKSEMKRVPNTDNSLKKGDLVMVLSDVAHGNFLGLTAIIPDNNYVLNQRMAGLGIKDVKKIDTAYLRLFINGNQSYFKKQGQGSSQQNLSKASVVDFPVLVPSRLLEQQKISSCLSSLDEVIAAYIQKVDLLKEHKKGLMQNLFPQDGETVPKYRFKEFEKDGEWVEKKLGDLGIFLGGGTPSRANSEYWLGNIPWISSSDINEDDIHSISISQYINQNAIIESATKIIPKGSILFVSRVGVGKLAINNEELCTSQDFTSFIPIEVLNFFVAYYFSANKNLLQALSQGTSIKGFSKSDLENSKILYPQNPQEQQKIAFCLSSLDALITAQAEKIAQLQLHKKGLMQGLFPKIND